MYSIGFKGGHVSLRLQDILFNDFVTYPCDSEMFHPHSNILCKLNQLLGREGALIGGRPCPPQVGAQVTVGQKLQGDVQEIYERSET